MAPEMAARRCALTPRRRTGSTASRAPQIQFPRLLGQLTQVLARLHRLNQGLYGKVIRIEHGQRVTGLENVLPSARPSCRPGKAQSQTRS